MSAADALRAAHAAGITVRLDGDGILLEADAEPAQGLLDVLARNKVAIVDLLKQGLNGWCAADWGAYFDARMRLVASRSPRRDFSAAWCKAEVSVIRAYWSQRQPP
jgi:hypothetical protein